jgi:hypothetical protein
MKALIRLAIAVIQAKSRNFMTKGIDKYLTRATIGKKRNANSKLDLESDTHWYHHTWVYTTEPTGIQ